MASLKSETLTIIVGGVAAVATAVTAPQFVGAPLTFIGGVLAGSSIAKAKSIKEQAGKDTASRVSGAFSAIYERNRGLVDPAELGFIANVSVNQAHAFLTSLAESTGGSKVASKDGLGVIFNFPHAANVLDELSQNAQAWASSQTAELSQQLEQHRQALRAVQLQQATMPPKAQIRQTNEDVWQE